MLVLFNLPYLILDDSSSQSSKQEDNVSIIYHGRKLGYIIFQTKRIYITELVPIMFPQCSHNVSISFPSHSPCCSLVPMPISIVISWCNVINHISHLITSPIIMAILVMWTFILPLLEVPNDNLMMIQYIY
jgi:hypothetical protein